MLLFMRIVGGALVLLAVSGFSSIPGDSGAQRRDDLIYSLMSLVLGGWLILRARQRAARDRRVALTRELLQLGKRTGSLTAPQVVAELSLTAEEARAALTQLSRDGLAQLEVDGDGSPVYRIQGQPGVAT